ncbi:MAG TPA: succinylglutamate desuccinylase/aspartoacylase family protein [Aliidongia sp.]|nr:succinylglutamate desuccinylase/aspartoacylase family protein [Aliidongia sp.]
MKTILTLPLPAQSPGTSRHLKLHRWGEIGASPKIYLQASLHADEIPAMLVAQHLIGLLDAAEREGRILGEIVLVPAVNPIGMGQVLDGTHLGRYELNSGENFNRGFADLVPMAAERLKGRLGPDAAANVALIRTTCRAILEESAPQGELAALRRLLMLHAIDADIVLDLHCDDDALMHLYLGEARWPDGADLSADLGSRATMLAADSGGASFDEIFSNMWARFRTVMGTEHPIPDASLAATVELRGRADVSDELASADAAALMRYMMRQGAVAGDPGPLPPAQCDGTSLAAVDWLRAPVAGLLVYKQALGARVSKGDLIAEIVDPLADDPAKARTEVRTITDGLIISRRTRLLARPGQAIAKIVGSVVLPTRTGALLDP